MIFQRSCLLIRVSSVAKNGFSHPSTIARFALRTPIFASIGRIVKVRLTEYPTQSNNPPLVSTRDGPRRDGSAIKLRPCPERAFVERVSGRSAARKGDNDGTPVFAIDSTTRGLCRRGNRQRLGWLLQHAGAPANPESTRNHARRQSGRKSGCADHHARDEQHS